MKVIGLTSPLRAEADRVFHGGFRSWLEEIRQGSWMDWAELLRHYPGTRRMDMNLAHFPLAADGGGIEAAVSFPSDPARLSLIRLLRVCPAPSAAVVPARAAARKISRLLAS
jgi:hypothetical protein